MIDPTKYMPVLQCYTCYNVTTPVLGSEHTGVWNETSKGF